MLKAFYSKAFLFLLVKKSKMDNTITVGTSSVHNSSYQDEKLIFPAASRNKGPILEVLQKLIVNSKEKDVKRRPIFLEIASGSGQHVAHFAPRFPNIRFQPSDWDSDLMGSMTYYANACKTKNILQPIQIDICEDLSQYGYKDNSIDYIYSANLLHISPFACTIGLFRNAGTYLKPNALLIIYGPFCVNGIITPQSNVDFDTSLRSRDNSWGLRDISELKKLGKVNNLSLIENVDMPSNNKTLVWKKYAG